MADLGGHLAAALPLLTHELEASSVQLSLLPHAGPATVPEAVAPRLGSDAGTRYALEAAGIASNNPRLALTPGEEARTLGTHSTRPCEPAWRRRCLAMQLDVLPCPVDRQTAVADVERRLLELVAPAAAGASEAPPYPLAVEGGAPDSSGLPLERDMHQELEASWRSHHITALQSELQEAAAGQSPLAVIKEAQARGLRSVDTCALAAAALPPVPHSLLICTAGHASLHVSCLQVHASSDRGAVESYLLQHILAVPGHLGCHGASLRLLRLAGAAPLASRLDLMRLVVQPDLLRSLNPFLSDRAHRELRAAAHTWLALCVLEDRLGRLAVLASSGPDFRAALVKVRLPYFWVVVSCGATSFSARCHNLGSWIWHFSKLCTPLQELLVHRTWDVSLHPEWLVFEAEGQLQIRPDQYTVARHLMDNPGAICQLNMGEGKTRVILPMLALHWAKGDRLVSGGETACLPACLPACLLNCLSLTQPA